LIIKTSQQDLLDYIDYILTNFLFEFKVIYYVQYITI
jgi:hypothetical protein